MSPAPDRTPPELPPFTPLDTVLRTPAPQRPGPTPPGTTDPTPETDDRRTRRMRANRAETRTDREHRLELEARRREQKRHDKAARKAQRRADKTAAREQRRNRRAERLAEHADRNARLKTIGVAIARRTMVIGPITAPMAVAWSSQTSYAMTAFGWWLPFALGFAAAWELSTTFTGWMYHQARRAGDRGTEYRILTWIFALGAAAMNYAHHAGPGGAPTQAAIAFSAMSVTGMVLWESYARLVHRQYLRAKGLLPAARPRLGVARWVRYPVHSWTAWSAAINDADLNTLDKAWTAADRILADRRAARTGGPLADRYVVTARVRTADHGPASIPAVHVDLARTDRTAPAGSDRLARTTGRKELSAGPVDRADQAAAADQRTSPADRTAKPSRTTPVDSPRTAAADQARPTTATAHADRTAGPDLDLNDMERSAIDRLRSTGRSISKRSIADVVRNELGGSIGSDRAAQLARHYRTLRSA